MNTKKILVVLGSTGAQGGAVVRHFLKTASGEFEVKAITRRPNSSAAKALQSAGAEIVQADMSDKASLEKAFKGAHIIFSVTNFFDQASVEEEIAQGNNAIDAAASAAADSLECFFWSSLPDPRGFTLPYYNVLHFNTKAEISKYLQKSPIWDKSTIIWVGAYFENYYKFQETYGPLKQPDGTYAISYPIKPDTMLYEVCVEDLGILVRKLASDPTRYCKRTVLMATQTITAPDQIKIWADHYRVEAQYKPVTLNAFVDRLVQDHGFPHSLALQLGENFAMLKDNPDMWTRVRGDPEKGDYDAMRATDIITGWTDWKTFVVGVDWDKLLK